MAGDAAKGSIEDLMAWSRSMDLVEAVYRLTTAWPRDELYGLINQARRAAVSVPSNLAEGHGRRTDGQFRHFVSIAIGSLMELKTQLLIASRLGYTPEADSAAVLALLDEVAKISFGLKKALDKR
ncbi:MAG: four helix bundle protein [Planctomycetes bacterium]|nr:four helix bundle protein [Planctomycetota bacterium]